MRSCRLKILATAAVFAGVVAFVWAPPASAVDNSDLFELEFDANADQSGALAGDDWETLWAACGDDGDPSPCGNSEVFTGIRPDPSGVTIFTGGNKDIKDLPDLGITSGSTPPKNEIQHAFAAAYTCGAPGFPTLDCNQGDIMLYFGADRDSHNGDAFLGFWFFKQAVGVSNGGFTGMKSEGDLLMLVNFPQAQNAVPIIAAVEWDTSCSKKDDNTPDPGECVAQNLRLIDIAEGEGAVSCDSDNAAGTPFATPHLFCASTNSSTQDSPWPFVPVDSGEAVDTFPFETFYEGGVNLTELTGGTCVASFLAESRSSSSFTAQLKDFLVADFPLCGINAAKACPTGRLGGEGLCQDTGLTCTADGDCGAGVCSGDAQIACTDDATCSGQAAGTCGGFPIACNQINPQFVAGNDFVTQFQVTINREGPGILHNVRFQEKAIVPNGTNAVCELIGRDGSLLTTPVALTFGTPVEVITEFTAASSTLTVECVTDGNVSSNRIIVDAKTNTGLTGPDLGGENTDGDVTLLPGTGLCAASPNPSINILKECLPDSTLVTTTITDTGVEFTIPAEITVTNTGDEDLVDVTVVDLIADIDTTFSLPAFASNVNVIDATYTTAFPDGETDDEISSGCNIMFTNTAAVTAAKGAATGFPLDVTGVESTDTCPLCPDVCERD